MVIKGSARAAPGELAYHLLREDTNELVTVLELSGVASLDLRGALAELDGMGAGSRARRTLYHASINTPVSEQLDPQQQRLARERLARRMGLEDQPYAVVQHVKHGRQHTHVVWSRVNAVTGRAIHDGFNYRKHEEVARELEREFDHERVQGVHVRDKTTEPRPQRGPSWGELRQAERSGLSPAEAKGIVTQAWRETKTSREFQQRVEGDGFTLARGDRRDFVLIDSAGEVHGLSRRIDGAKAAQIRERLSDLDPDQLPDVAEARRQVRFRHALQDENPDRAFTGVSERLRAEELRREADARLGTGQGLSNAHQEAADAVWQLSKTMRSQIGATVIAGQPVSTGFDTGRMEAANSNPESVQAPVQQPLREAERRNEPQPVPIANEPRRPSAILLVEIFGWVVDHYRRLIDRRTEATATADPSPAVPANGDRQAAPPARRETFLDRLRQKSSDEAEARAQEERDRAAQQLRDELKPYRDGSRKKLWENDT